MTWHRISRTKESIEFQDNDLAIIEVAGKKITIGRFNREIFAFAYQCPHAAAPLADGYIDAKGQVVCPMHSFKFSMSTGRNTSGEGYPLKRWALEVRDDGVYVGF